MLLVTDTRRKYKVGRNQAVQLAKRRSDAYAGAADDLVGVEAPLRRPEEQPQDAALRLGEKGFTWVIVVSSHIGNDNSLPGTLQPGSSLAAWRFVLGESLEEFRRELDAFVKGPLMPDRFDLVELGFEDLAALVNLVDERIPMAY